MGFAQCWGVTVPCDACTDLLSLLSSSFSAFSHFGLGLLFGKMWSGGCGTHPGSGWHYYCLSRQLYYTGAGYLRKASNTRHAAQRAGFFNVVWCKDMATL